MTTPSGTPPWLHESDSSTYGGNTDKTNYQGQDVVNPKTDISAEAFLRLAADVAAIQRVMPLGTFGIQCDDTTPADPTVTFANLASGNGTVTYAGGSPPSGYPTVTRVSDGRVKFTFPTSLSDDHGVNGTVHLIGAEVSVVGASGQGVGEYVLYDPNVDTYNEAVDAIFNDGGSPSADALGIVTLYTGSV